MSENVKNGLLILVTVVTLANTVMIMTNDGVSYEKTPVNENAVSSAAANPNQAAVQNNMNNNNANNNQANVVKPNDGPKTSLKFAEMTHDFGQIQQNTTNKKKFQFTNTGENPLIISNAKGSCGCTVPQYPREPIAPGETGEILVEYRPGTQKNKQTKTVTITANTEPATTVLRITADVEVPEGAEQNQAGQTTQPIQIGS
ncbi:MAG: DUF1573 domain-containing protein [Vicingaceae bacterium]